MLRVEVRQGDVTTADVDVIVNASNTTLALGSGVSGAIRRACGRGYQEELELALRARSPDGLAPGAVIVTHAGAHRRARWVAHVAVMDYRPGAAHPRPTLERIRAGADALWAELDLISNEPLSVGMVALGAGTGALGLRDTTDVACRSLAAHHAARPTSRVARVVFHGYELHEFANTLHVVRRHFPVEEGELDPDVLAYVRALG